jgi:hypothetical protein
MDAEDACFMDRLPFAMRDSFLQQAFQLLGQHERFKVVPLVCHLWRQLVPSTCSSLVVKVRDDVAAKSFTSWLERHHTPFQSIGLNFECYSYWPGGYSMAEGYKLLEGVCSKVSLRSLSIYAVDASNRNLHLSSLTNLTNLETLSLTLGGTACKSLVLPTQLRHLTLIALRVRYHEYAWLGDVVGSLVHLTVLQLSLDNDVVKPQQLLFLTKLGGLINLNLADTTVQAEGIAALRQLPITNVMFNFIRHDDVGEICSWLKGGRGRLITLELIGGAGESLQEVELLLSHLSTFEPQLQELGIYCMEQLGHSTGLAGLTQLTRLTVDMDWDIADWDDAGMRCLSALTGLQELMMLYDTTEAAGWQFECIASSLQQLTALKIEGGAAAAIRLAKAAFGSRVVDAHGWGLTLKPGVPAGE